MKGIKKRLEWSVRKFIKAPFISLLNYYSMGAMPCRKSYLS
jgi:hypothetical protein